MASEEMLIKELKLSCFLYIITCKNCFDQWGNFYKIGVSRNPKQRVKEVQTGNPYRIKIYYSTEFIMRGDAFTTESYIKADFRDKGVQSKGGTEWFKLYLDDIEWIEKYADEQAKILNHKALNPPVSMRTPAYFNAIFTATKGRRLD